MSFDTMVASGGRSELPHGRGSWHLISVLFSTDIAAT